MQAEAVADRDVLEKGTRAFVSFVRGYREHVCRFIFRLDQLDVPALALALGLVKLPKVDELRALKLRFEGVPGVVTGAIAYKDPVREAQRQARLAADGDKLAAERAARDARRDRALAAEARSAQAAAPSAPGDAAGERDHEHDRKRKRSHKGLRARVLDDFALLARESKLEKRRRDGKISKAEYRRELIALHREQGIEASEDDLVEMLSSDGADEDRGGMGANEAAADKKRKKH